MAIKNARKPKTKKRTNATTSSSVAMAEMPPPQAANHVQPPPPPLPQLDLPPGVYFSPTRTECLELLNRSIAGDTEMSQRDTWGCVREGNIYGQHPDALRQQHPPASIRDREHTWWFLSQTKFQSQEAGGGASKRADRRVETGGYWRLEQSKEKLDDDGFKNTFGYYVDGRSKSKAKDKTPWLMQEFTSANDDGAGKGGVPAMYRVYVTPRATDEQQRQLFGEDGVKLYPNAQKRPARTLVPEEYFDRVAELLPQGSVRPGVAQEQVKLQEEHYYHGQYELQVQPPPLPPVAPEGSLDFYSQQEQYPQYQQDQYEQQQQGQYSGYQQDDQCLGQYEQQQQGQGQYSGYQQDDQYLGQYEQQQQGQLPTAAPPLPPPASPGLLAELAGDAPPDNLSMPMDDFMRVFDDDEQPAETVVAGEPIWDLLVDIVTDDVLTDFNKQD